MLTIEQKSILKIGSVFSVEGRSIQLLIDRNKNSSDLLYKGSLIKNITVGSYIKIKKGFIDLIGIVEGEYLEGNKNNTVNLVNEGQRLIRVSLLGFIENNIFYRGIKEMPLIGNNAYLLTSSEFIQIHDLSKKNNNTIQIGSLAFDEEIDINIGVNSIFSGHIGIFGNTGSGKSYTLAKLYEKYLPHFIGKKDCHFILLDFNGEYGEKAISENKKLIKLRTQDDKGDKILFPESFLGDVTFWSILLDATEKTQRPFLKRSLMKELPEISELKTGIKEIYQNMIEKNDPELGQSTLEEFTLDLKPFVSDDLATWAANVKFHANNNNQYYWVPLKSSDPTSAYSKETIMGNFPGNYLDTEDDLFTRFHLHFICRYYYELVQGYFNEEHIKPLLKRFHTRIKDIQRTIKIGDFKKDASKPMTVISLHHANLQMKKMLPLLICKYFYEEHKHDDEKKYLNIIIDEAHNILSYTSDRENKDWKDYRLETFEEIIKEGRKFGVFLTIASQRPADITHTIISQIHTFFLHRLVNDQDIQAIKRTVSYLSLAQFEALSSMPTGYCVMAGYQLNFPLILKINTISDGNEPDSQTLDIDQLINGE